MAILLGFIMLGPISMASVLVPEWDGRPGTTSALFAFATGDKEVSPTSSRNPYGSVTMLVENETVWGAGWMAPGDPYGLTRGNGGGAWDLGQHGLISIMVPVSEIGRESVNMIDLFMHVIWYQGPMGTPGFEMSGQTPSYQNLVDLFVEADGPGAWYGTTWEATFDNVTDNELTLSIQAPWNGAVVESIAIYTRTTPVPEPSSLLLLGLAAGGLPFLRKRKTPGDSTK